MEAPKEEGISGRLAGSEARIEHRTGWRDATPHPYDGAPLIDIRTRRPRPWHPRIAQPSELETTASRWSGYFIITACTLALATIILPALWAAIRGAF